MPPCLIRPHSRTIAQELNRVGVMRMAYNRCRLGAGSRCSKSSEVTAVSTWPSSA
jgi:hypothetical protein